MARRGDRQIMTVVDTADEVKQWIAKTDEQLVLVDVFDEWCGYTKVLEPTYNRLTLEVDDFEERIKLLALPKSKLDDELRELFPVEAGCRPFFVVLKHKVVIGKVQGANAPELENIMVDNLFPLP